MAWQDDMDELDSDVAAGRISTEQYRSRRAEIRADPGSGSPGGPDPFPPPFRWGDPADTTTSSRAAASGPGDDAADRTQVVHRAATPPDADRTQVVHRAAPPRPTVPGPPPAPPWGQEPPVHARVPQLAGAGPWDGGFPPRQGNDFFDEFRPPRRNGKLVSAGAVVVTVAAVAAITFFGLTAGADGRQAVGGTPTAQDPPGATVLAVPPGDLRLDARFATFTELGAAGVLSAEDLAVFGPHQPGRTDVLLSTAAGTTTGVWVFELGDDPGVALAGMDVLYTGVGFVPVDPVTPGVRALVLAPPAGQPGTTMILALHHS